MRITIERDVRQNSQDLLYEETKQLLLRQISTVEAIDTKASIVAGLDGVLIGAALGLLGNAQQLLQTAAKVFQPWVVPAAAALGTASGLGSAAVALLVAFWPRTYKETLNPRKAYKRQFYRPEKQTKLQWLHNWIVSYEENCEPMERKATGLKWALALLILSLAVWSALGVALVLVAALHPNATTPAP